VGRHVDHRGMGTFAPGGARLRNAAARGLGLGLGGGGGGGRNRHTLTPSQLSLVVSCIFCSLSVSHGLGKHVEFVAPDHVAIVGFTWQWTGTFAILAATLSKTSFAVTLLRVLDGSSLRVLLWFIIVTMNVAMSLNAIFGWVRCTPVEKTWNISTPGTCWTPGIYAQYGMFAGGKLLSPAPTRGQR